MRILHVTDASAAGVLASVTALANAQAAMPEVETVRFCYTPRPESPPHPSIAQNLGGDVEVVRWERSSRRALLGLVRGLRREYRRGDWDLVHLHSSRAGFIGRILAALTDHHAGIVYSPHGFAFNRKDFNPLLVRAFLAMERLALHGGRRIVVVSESEAGVAHTQLRGSQSAVLPNSVDLKVFTSPEVDTESSLQKPIKVVHLGRIMDQKRPRVFADIAARAHKSFPGRFDFTWIGDGDRELLASEDASVKITGWLSADDIRGQLSQSDILLFTSAGEGLPISLLEAQAMRLATIGENVAHRS